MQMCIRDMNLQDMADFGNAMQYAVGVDYLFINGVPVIDYGELTKVKPGQLLRRSDN